MNETNQKITPAQINESQENLKAKYELEIEAAQQAILKAKKELTDKDEEIFELQKQNKKLASEVDDWKTEAHRNRRIEQAKQATKQQNDFKTEYIKLQEQKGWKWSEERGWTR
ncbi:MAG: hypothetical protein MRECE_19c022 [Mycoplasmataceae bacterium CE_OT135]|nr:MAG: hypothetical protein MRECE_19c022 [Mycoplasmataceae bacterium CE_OT135]